MPGVGISRCIITLEPALGASPPPRVPERADRAPALPPAHLSAKVVESNEEKADD